MRLWFPLKEHLRAVGVFSVWYYSPMPLIASLTLIIGIQFAALHALAEYFSLYWRFSWLDIPMHIVGGVLIVLCLHTLVAVKTIPTRFTLGLIFPLIMATILIGWEIFGVVRFGGIKPDYLIDTSLDLVFGILGISLGHYLARALTKL